MDADRRSVDEREVDALITHVVDQGLLQATSITDPEHGDFNQVVLVSPGLDTRPYRLPWRTGVVIYDISHPDVHTFRKTRLNARAPSGCLHIPISLEHVVDTGSLQVLENHGFRGDRLSVWGIQGLHLMAVDKDQLESLFLEISQLCRFRSIVLGELPIMNKTSTIEFLSHFSLQGSVNTISDYSASLNRDLTYESERCVFLVQQQLRSLAELAIYAAHVEAADETDEDFFGNFS